MAAMLNADWLQFHHVNENNMKYNTQETEFWNFETRTNLLN
jgi:hypothetical protein